MPGRYSGGGACGFPPYRHRESANLRTTAFDLLRRAGEDLAGLSYERRRKHLEALFVEWSLAPPWTLCPMTRDRQEAMRWMRQWAAAGRVLSSVRTRAAGVRAVAVACQRRSPTGES